MGKSKKGTKRKNPGVGMDFKRAKHKVGRSLPRAQNDTSVAFRSKAITLPGQSVAADRAGAAVSSHNLTLKELLGQVGHYSERMRASALAGLADLLSRHPGQATKNTGPLLEALAPRISDTDAVRKALLQLLSGQVLPIIGATGLRPFLPLLMAHVSSAMTSLSDAVRTDALGFLAALMAVVPGAVAAGFMAPALAHFGDLLGRDARGASIKSRSLAMLHKAVSGLLSFLSKAADATAVVGRPEDATAATSATSPPAVQQPSTPQRKAEAAPLAWRRSAWPAPAATAIQTAAIAAATAHIHRCGGAQQAPSPGGGSAPTVKSTRHAATSPDGVGLAVAAIVGAQGDAAAAAAQLAGRLLDAWADCGPGQLRSAPELAATEAMADLLACLQLLLPHLRSPPSELLSLQAGILAKVASDFPAAMPAVPPPPPLRAALSRLNLAAAALLTQALAAKPPAQSPEQQQHQSVAAAASLLPALPAAAGPRQKRQQKQQQRKQQQQQQRQAQEQALSPPPPEPPWVLRLVQFYVGVLRDGTTLPAEDKERAAGSGKGSEAAPEAVQSALQGVALVLPCVTPESQALLLDAVASLATRSPSKSPVRAACLRLQGGLLAAFTLRTHAANDNSWACVSEEGAAQWVQGLPKLLWELGDSAPATSAAALRLLLDAGRTATPGGPLASALTALQPQMAPLLGTLLPAKQPKAQKKAAGKQSVGAAGGRVNAGAMRFMAGPLARLPAECQTTAVDLSAFHESLHEGSLRAAAMAALGSVYPPGLGARAVDVIALRAAAGAAPPAQWHSLLAALLLGSMAGVPAEDSWQRHRTIVDAACRALRAFGSAGDSWRLLEPLLLAQWQTAASRRRALYGVLRGAAAAAESPADAVPATAVAQAASVGHGSGHSSILAQSSATGGGVMSAGGRAALPALMQQYALLSSPAAAAAAGPGSAPGGGAAGQQAPPAQQNQDPDPLDPGLQPVLELLRLDAGLLPPLLAALGATEAASTPAAAATLSQVPPGAQPPPVSASSAAGPADAASGSGAAAGGDEATLRAASGALAVLAAVLAAPPLRAAILEAEAPLQQLIDSLAQATRCVGVGTAAGEQCQQQLRNAQSSVDVLYGRLPHG